MIDKSINNINYAAVPLMFVLVPFIVDMANGQDVESDIIIQRANVDNDIS